MRQLFTFALVSRRRVLLLVGAVTVALAAAGLAAYGGRLLLALARPVPSAAS